jgi:succinyl-CoA synthetase beta subunit
MFGTASRSLVSSVVARRAGTVGSTSSTARSGGAVRFLNVHEYVSMDIMKSHGVKVPECFVATTPEEAKNIFQNKINKRTYILNM